LNQKFTQIFLGIFINFSQPKPLPIIIYFNTQFGFKMAFKYLSWALFPLLGGYAIYSLVYDEQKGWYSWIL
jgi:hypothetical protein